MRVSIYAIAAFALLAWLSPTASPAQKESKKARAQEHYNRALAYEDLKDWDNAIAEYEIANALHPDAEFHYLIGEAYASKGDNKAALERYKKYLAAEPRGRVSKKARAAIRKLERMVAAEENARRAKVEEQKRKAADEERKRKRAEAAAERERRAKQQTTHDAVQPAGLTDDPARDESSDGKAGRGLRISGISTAGAGVVALGLGVVFGLQARRAQADVEQQWNPERFDEGESADAKMKIMVGVGVVAVAGGAALFVLGTRTRKSAETQAVGIAPSVGPDAFGVVVHRGF